MLSNYQEESRIKRLGNEYQLREHLKVKKFMWTKMLIARLGVLNLWVPLRLKGT